MDRRLNMCMCVCCIPCREVGRLATVHGKCLICLQVQRGGWCCYPVALRSILFVGDMPVYTVPPSNSYVILFDMLLVTVCVFCHPVFMSVL